MRKTYQFSEGRISENPDGDGILWVYINPEESEKRFLCEKYQIDEHTLACALDPDELSRLEFEPDHLAMIYKNPRNVSSPEFLQLKVNSTGLFLFKDRLIMVLPEDAPFSTSATAKHLNRLPPTPAVLMLGMLYRSITHFLEHLKVINLMSADLEQKINASMDNKYLIGLFNLEKSLVYYVNAINSNGMLLEKMRQNSAKIGLSAEETALLDDILIDNAQCFKQADIYSNILAGLMDARVSIVGNNLNNLMKTLNVIMIAIMVPTLVVSIFSMNVTHPLDKDSQWSFWFVMCLSVLSALGVHYAWKKHKW